MNETGTPITNFTLFGPDGSFTFGAVAPRGRSTTSTVQSTAYKVPYNYSFTCGGQTFSGTAVAWGDEDDRGPWKGYLLHVRSQNGAMVVFAVGDGPP